MRTLAKHPPEGWTASMLASHAPSRLAMLRAARKAARELRSMPEDGSTLVHLHAASDWSLRRKLRLAAACKAPVVLHLHSGDTARWLGASPKRVEQVRSAIQRHVNTVVVLDDAWKVVLEPLIGRVDVVPNPIDPVHRPAVGRDKEGHHLLVMGRDAPVKRRAFALDVLTSVRHHRPSVHLHLTGGQPSQEEGWTRHGWLSEAERLELLHNSSALLLPSRFEGQPLAALEALACGVPVIADGGLVGLPHTVVRPPEATVEAWTQAVLETLNAPVDATVLCSSVAHHTVEHVASRWGEVYSTVQQTSTT
ncbi:MAG: glycosyltransferase family 4 protein [Candidatus Poseidoniaceae archaeon]